MRNVRRTPASAQLEWVIAALDGDAITEADVADRLSAAFQSQFPPAQWVAILEAQAPRLRPFTVASVDVDEHKARARLSTADGTDFVVSCVTDGDGKVATLAVAPAIRQGLTPRLPMRFDAEADADTEPGTDDARTTSARLIVVGGVPGTGKSTLADRLGAHLTTPVFALDWLLGALTPFGGRSFDNLGDIGEELLTTLAYRQLVLGQSAIIDTPGENVDMRARWQSMAAHFGADFRVVVCTCSDGETHRQRLSSRVRGIPGWHDGGNWSVVEPRRDNFPAWVGDEVIVIDAVTPADDVFGNVLDWLTTPR